VSSPGNDPDASSPLDGDRDLPAVDFQTFVLSLCHSVLVHLGDAPNPVDGTERANLPLARQTIDLLNLLQEKTRNNLTGEEERTLVQALYDLRMRYVEVLGSR
jgi:hypothetical protein